MADVSLPRSNSNNGTATPASPGSITAVAGDALFIVIAALGTSPTIAAPSGFSTIEIVNGATLSCGLFKQLNTGGGAINPNAVLGGTVTGWVAIIVEFTQTGANCGIQGSNHLASSVAQLTNLFPTTGQTLSNELFIYAVARATATLTPQNSFNSPLAVWSASVQPQAGVQGLSLDFFWASGLGQGVGQYPQASGLLSAAVASVAVGAWVNTTASQPSNNDNVNGQAGLYVPQQYAGMIGG